MWHLYQNRANHLRKWEFMYTLYTRYDALILRYNIYAPLLMAAGCSDV
jgi:hypothetical protein